MTTRVASRGWCTVQSETSNITSPMSGVWSGNRCSRSRPTIPRMIRSSSTSPAVTSRVSMVLPSRRMVIASATRSISLSLWLIMIDVMPLPCSPLSRSSRCWESSSLRAAVGSSRMSSLTSLPSALAISTSCCFPMPRCLTGVSGFSRRPTRASSSMARWLAGVPADHAAVGGLVAEEDVLGDRELGDQRELLVDDHDPGGFAVPDVLERDGLSLEDDLAVVGAVRVDAAEHLHQRRLARAVLSADGVDLTAVDGQGDVRQRLDAGELLGDGPHLQDRFVHRD